MSDFERFKLNGLIASLTGDKHFVFCGNFNLPFLGVETGRLPQLLEVVQELIQTEFHSEIRSEDLYYKVSAIYEIVNDATGDARLWLGSFNPRTTNDIYLLSQRPFSSASFVGTVTEALGLDRVVQLLTAAGKDSRWTFSSLKSFVLSFQCRGSYAKHVFSKDSRVFPSRRYLDIVNRKNVAFERNLEGGV